MERLRATRCEINLDRLDHNISVLRSRIASGVQVMAVIKADAYGHGAVALMPYLLQHGIRWFGVATLAEAMELRRFYAAGDILVFGLSPDQLLHYGAENNIVQTICSYRQAKLLDQYGQLARVMIKMDSGLHRLGLRDQAACMDEAAAIASLPGLDICGCYTHLAVIDEEQAQRQFERYQRFVSGCAERGVHFPIKSVCDGIACVRYPEFHLDMVRPGALLYGYNPDLTNLPPVMQLKTEVAFLQTLAANEGLGYYLQDAADHERRIATLPIGFVDGCPRALSKKGGWVSIRGRRAPFAGMSYMDQATVDVSDIPGVQIGDEVIVLGGDGGAMTWHEASLLCDVNRNGLQASISRRVPRVYFEQGKEVAYRDYLFDLAKPAP